MEAALKNKETADFDTDKYVEGLRERLRRAADSMQAAPMEAYMRNKFPFWGIKAPQRREIYKQYIAEQGLPPLAKLEECMLLAWEEEHREMQYTALDIALRFQKKLKLEHLPLFETLLLSKSWWDTADIIVARGIGGIFANEEPEVGQQWALSITHEDPFWRQRAAILYQLSFKEKTNKELLFTLCSKFSGSKEFFVRKAIGWALRQYAKVDDRSVIAFVEKTPLAALSKREALKHCK